MNDFNLSIFEECSSRYLLVKFHFETSMTKIRNAVTFVKKHADLFFNMNGCRMFLLFLHKTGEQNIPRNYE